MQILRFPTLLSSLQGREESSVLVLISVREYLSGSLRYNENRILHCTSLLANYEFWTI